MPQKRSALMFQEMSEYDSVSYRGRSNSENSESGLYIHPMKAKSFVLSLESNEILAQTHMLNNVDDLFSDC